MICNSCNEEVGDGASFCPHCGEKIEKEIVCSKCKSINTPSSNYCINCGGKLEKVNQKSHIILDDEYIIRLFGIFYGKFNEKFEMVVNIENLHERINFFNPVEIQSIYKISVRESFDFLIQSWGKELNESLISILNDRYESFIKNDSIGLFHYLDELKNASNELLVNTESNFVGEIIKSVIQGVDIGMESQSRYSELGSKGATTVGMLKSYKIGRDEDLNKQGLINRYNLYFEKVVEELNKCWIRFYDYIYESEQRFPIKLKIEDEALLQRIFEGKPFFDDMIQEIIHDNLVVLVNPENQESIFKSYDAITDKKLERAAKYYLQPFDEGELIISLFDNTLFGSGKSGVAITNKGIHWKNYVTSEIGCQKYNDIKSFSFNNKNGSFYINEEEIKECEIFGEYLYNAIEQITKYLNNGIE